MLYPTAENAQTASLVQLTGWVRYLPSPANDNQVTVMNIIWNRYNDLKRENPQAATSASKLVGLG